MTDDQAFWLTICGASAIALVALQIGFGDKVSRWWRRRRRRS